MKTGRIYLIPSLLNDENISVIPEEVKKIADSIDVYLVENERSARRYLRKIDVKKEFTETNMRRLDKKTSREEISLFVDLLKTGNSVGVVSEAGCPCIADPGAEFIRLAHRSGYQVVPLVGPSSILLALIASGLNGQKFSFHGYLPIPATERKKMIRSIELESAKQNQTQIFMEVPHRNQSILKDVIEVCHADTDFCIASNLTSSKEYISTKSIKEWRGTDFSSFHKQPAIFLLLARA